MPWCPVCKTEYRAGFRLCSDCMSELVEVLEPEAKPPVYTNDAWRLLMSPGNDYEADLIEAMLTANKIPILRKDQGAGGYLKIYMGMTSLGIDLYVPESMFEDARQLVGLNHSGEDKKQPRAKTGYRIRKPANKRERAFALWLLSIIFGLVYFLLEALR